MGFAPNHHHFQCVSNFVTSAIALELELGDRRGSGFPVDVLPGTGKCYDGVPACCASTAMAAAR